VNDDYNGDVRLLPELIAIQEFQQLLQSPRKDTAKTFLEWLTVNSIKLINIADGEQFWLKKQLALAK
jgi:hypothetical protein